MLPAAAGPPAAALRDAIRFRARWSAGAPSLSHTFLDARPLQRRMAKRCPGVGLKARDRSDEVTSPCISEKGRSKYRLTRTFQVEVLAYPSLLQPVTAKWSNVPLLSLQAACLLHRGCRRTIPGCQVTAGRPHKTLK